MRNGSVEGTAARSYRALRRLASFERRGKDLRCEVEADGRPASVTFTLFDDGIVRYRLVGDEAPRFRYDLCDPARAARAIEPQVSERGELLEIRGVTTALRIRKDPWEVELLDLESGRRLCGELANDLDAHDNVVSPSSGFAFRGDSLDTVRINLELAPGESYFGLGEKFRDLDRRGQIVTCWNTNPFGAGTERSYKTIPLLLSTGGYGLFLNETASSTWDVGCTSNFSLSIELDGPSLELYLIPGPSLKEILARYADLVGRPALPPRWSFGVWYSPFGTQRTREGGMNQGDFVDLADRLRAEDLPGDVIHFDPFWMGGTRLCHFQWDRSLFPDPQRMIADLRERGYRTCLWEHPYIEKGSEIYEEAAGRGFLLKHADGSVYDAHVVYISPDRKKEYTEEFYAYGGMVDFSSPEAREWYKGKHRPLLEMGVAAFKTDFGEVTPYDACYANGATGREMHNLYPLLYNQTVFEVEGEYSEAPVLWGRSGYAGSQRFPIQWSGDPLSDFRNLAATLRAGLSYGMSGVPFWSFDLGGFKGAPTPEAYVRWAQAGLLLSHSRFHGTTPREPWAFGPEILAIVRDWIKLRYRLLPYIYGVALDATRTGLPVMRALALEFEADPGSRATETEYLLGASLLVCPVLNPEGLVSAYLPPGAWYDFRTCAKLEGARVVEQRLGLAEMPLYVREGGIIVLANPTPTVPDVWEQLEARFYPGPSASIELPESEGRTATVVRREHSAAGTRVEIAGPARRWELRFEDTDHPGKVLVQAGGSSSWRYDAATRELVVIIEKSGEVSVELSRGGGQGGAAAGR